MNRAIRGVVLAMMLANGCGGGHAGVAPDGGGAGRDGGTDGASAAGGSSGSGSDAAAGKSGDARTTGGAGGSTGAGGGGSTGTGGGAGSGGTRDGGGLGEGGTSDASARDDGPRNSDGDGGCIAACSTRTPSTFCAGGAVEWVCNGSSDLSPFTAACQMVASGAIRYCCPAAFFAQCQ